MKRNTIVSILTLVVIALLESPDVRAQTLEVTQISVPFVFKLGEQRLPSGNYLIHRLSPQVPNVLRIMSKDGALEASTHTTMPIRIRGTA